MTESKPWTHYVAHAEQYKALDQIEHSLYRQRDYPWEFVTGCEPGGTHRLEIDTNVWFRAKHPSGLRFRWSFDIEPYSANGSGSYQIDVDGCLSVLHALPAEPRKQFAEYLSTCSAKVRENADKYAAIAKREYAVADALERAGKGLVG